MNPVVVFGATGMLGSMVTRYLSESMPVIATVRNKEQINPMPNVEYVTFDVLKDNPSAISEFMVKAQGSWAVNCIGMIWQRHSTTEMATWAMFVNSWFPEKLAYYAESLNIHVIQPATDCVFSGRKGRYTESDVPDAQDVYGLSKAKGEIHSANIHHLRCSIIGTESHKRSLLGWFLSLPQGARVNGYTNHIWNGITTLSFARICQGIITNNYNLGHMQHIVPNSSLSKYELLDCFRKYFGREDINLVPGLAEQAKDMTLETVNHLVNLEFWNMAGHDKPPTIRNMVKQLAKETNGNKH